MPHYELFTLGATPLSPLTDVSLASASCQSRAALESQSLEQSEAAALTQQCIHHSREMPWGAQAAGLVCQQHEQNHGPLHMWERPTNSNNILTQN